MKVLVIFVFLVGLNAWTQDTLWEQGAMGYSRYYVVHPENRFEYYFHHCTGTNYGKGSIEKGLTEWKFHYDSIPTIPHSYSFSKGNKTDSLEIRLVDARDSLPYKVNDLIFVNNQVYSDSNRILIPRNEKKSESLYISAYPCNLEIPEIPMKQSLLVIYVGDDPWKTYESPKTIRLKVKNGELIERQTSRQINEEKPWKRGRKLRRSTVFSRQHK